MAKLYSHVKRRVSHTLADGEKWQNPCQKSVATPSTMTSNHLLMFKINHYRLKLTLTHLRQSSIALYS